jgi:hypothetical protein
MHRSNYLAGGKSIFDDAGHCWLEKSNVKGQKATANGDIRQRLLQAATWLGWSTRKWPRILPRRDMSNSTPKIAMQMPDGSGADSEARLPVPVAVPDVFPKLLRQMT